MAKTDAQRRAENKYAAKNLTVVGCKVTKEEAEEFARACEARGTTKNAVLKEAIKLFVAETFQVRAEIGLTY